MPLCILSPPTNASLGITFINSIMLSSYVNCRTIHSCLLTSQRQLWIVQTKAVLFCFDQSKVLFFNPKWRYFPRGSMLKNPPCNTGEAGLIPGPRAKIPHASCMLGWHYWAWTLWSPCATSRESGNPNERSYVMQWRSIGLQLRPDGVKHIVHSLFSRSVMSNSLRPHGLQHARLAWPSSSPRVCSNPCPLNQWCQSTISSSVIPFSSCPQSLPASGSFPVSQLFTSGGQSIEASASASVLPIFIGMHFRVDFL